MTLTMAQPLDTIAADFDRLQSAVGPGADLLRPLRQRAMERFAALGFPTSTHEDWRFTNLRPLIEGRFTHDEASPTAGDLSSTTPHAASIVTAEDVARLRPRGLEGPLVVFVDGHHRPDLSRIDGPGAEDPSSLTVTDLAQSLRDDPAGLLDHLDEMLDEQDAFSALNAAFLARGAVIIVPRGFDQPHPIHLLNIAGPASAGRVTHPRNLVFARAGSRLDIVEHYVALDAPASADAEADSRPHWTNAVTEIAVGPDARVAHYFLENEGPRAFNVSTLAVRQERGSRFESHSALLGGALVRNNVRIELAGEGCDLLINGLFVGRDRQQLDNHMRVVHASPNCASRQFYKGILDGRSRGVFTGRIVVRPGAQKTDAKQTSRNLVLSDDARVDVQPQLEIHADDVKCTHGATTGRLDTQALFYLRSRGIDPQAARAMLIFAFANESLERMALAPVREALEAELIRRLPRPEILRGLAQSGEPQP
ncbi:MAG: Fe-S cluster assembly protein SufD [Planctomycetota bacterium]|nr:Fe-S cluster assembly protein SufD [Planctomycetota bacterium]